MLASANLLTTGLSMIGIGAAILIVCGVAGAISNIVNALKGRNK